MSNGSSHRAVGPFVNGQQQNGQSEHQAFAQLAEYLAGVNRAIQSREPIPPVPPNLSIPRVRGRDILFRMLDAIGQGTGRADEFLGSFMYANESAGKALYDAIQSRRTSNIVLFHEAETLAKSFRLRTKRYGHPMPDGVQYDMRSKADVERIRDSLHFDDAATKAFEHYVPTAEVARKPPEPIPTRDGGKPTAKPAKATKATAKPARKAVADMGDEKSAKTDEKPAKAVEPFAKLFGWIGKLKVSSTAKLVLAEVINHSQGCPFTWVGNKALANTVGKSDRQVSRVLKKLDEDGHITVRAYGGTWCKTQRIIFVNRLAESAGIDPKTIGLPEGRREFWAFRARFNGQNKPKKPKRVVTTTAGIKADNPESVALYSATKMSGGHDIHVARKDKGFSAPKGAEKTHTPIVVSTSPPKGVLPPTGVEETTKPAPSAKPVPGSEHAAVEAKKVSTARPPMDWPERNLPTVNRESELARMVRLGRVTHLHPRWLDGLACWVVRRRKIDGQDVFLPPKSMDDGWIVNTVDTVVVPLIDPENRRVSQDEFRRLIAAGPMVAPDQNKPVVEPG